MNTGMMVEISMTLIVSILAIALSAYSISVARKRHDVTELKEATEKLTAAITELQMVKDAVMGKPTMGERLAAHDTKLAEHERRITNIEKSDNT